MIWVQILKHECVSCFNDNQPNYYKKDYQLNYFKKEFIIASPTSE